MEPSQFLVWTHGSARLCVQYLAMDAVAGDSWSQESIGFEDQTGTVGVQVAALIPGGVTIPNSTSPIHPVPIRWRSGGLGMTPPAPSRVLQLPMLGPLLVAHRQLPTDLAHANRSQRCCSFCCQISYGAVPPPGTAYMVPPSCHVTAGDNDSGSCCTSQICFCEGSIVHAENVDCPLT